MNARIAESWKEHLGGEFQKEYFKTLTEFVRDAYQNSVVYPHPKNIFRAFDLCAFEDVRVVILGQDPYHGAGQANGLCFSVGEGVRHPPSLQNIFKEILADTNTPSQCAEDGDLSAWARQGVLLLNATLTVESGNAGSHQNKGWEEFTDAVIAKLSEKRDGIVFVLWGNYAKKKGGAIDADTHHILEAAHPSPLSAHSGFFGCKHFSKVNEYLKSKGEKEIEW